MKNLFKVITLHARFSNGFVISSLNVTSVTMNSDPGILCFQHCVSSVFCSSLPQFCPVCRQELNDSVHITPFRVPYPFVRANQTPCSIVLKPSKGDFLNNYKANDDLHIGVTNSSSIVFEYDIDGLRNSKTDSWNESLCVFTLPLVFWRRKWDDTLNSVAENFDQSNDSYDENNFNCYSFVLTFVKNLNYSDFQGIEASKEKFCEKFVIPKMATACKYVLLFRRLRDAAYVVE